MPSQIATIRVLIDGSCPLCRGEAALLRRVDRRIPNVLAAVALTTVLSWALGFQKNQKVDLSRIESARVAELVRDYNTAVERRTTLEVLRTEPRLPAPFPDVVDVEVFAEYAGQCG